MSAETKICSCGSQLYLMPSATMRSVIRPSFKHFYPLQSIHVGKLNSIENSSDLTLNRLELGIAFNVLFYISFLGKKEFHETDIIIHTSLVYAHYLQVLTHPVLAKQLDLPVCMRSQ